MIVNIVLDSRRVLNALYELITENSSTLEIEINTDEMASAVNMSKQHLNLCIHYLIASGYVTGSFTYDNQKNAKKQLTFTALGINKIENTAL